MTKCANYWCNKEDAELGNGICLLCDSIEGDIRLDYIIEQGVALENEE